SFRVIRSPIMRESSVETERRLSEEEISIQQPESSKSQKTQKREDNSDNREIFASPLVWLLADLRKRDGAEDDRDRGEQRAAATTRNQSQTTHYQSRHGERMISRRAGNAGGNRPGGECRRNRRG